ncbi:DUF4307 domain-containing protein [Sanguibacter sp. A247]|uniref:DUF4307 domain-containing protein n=1 Tax=unclassified Sanguibacter TaxID=2645534 RepID=UPI003FD8EA2B
MTSSPSTPTGPTDLDDRYGRLSPDAARSRTLRIAAILGLALATAGAGWAGWSMVAGEPWTTKPVGYSVKSAELTEVTFHVTKRADLALRCSVVALAENYSQVGYRDVVIPASSGERESFTVDVRTSERATTGMVEACEPVAD